MDKKSIKWLIKNTKKSIPMMVSLAIAASAISFGILMLAVVSKNIIDIAIGTKEGSLFTQTVLLVVIVLSQALLNIYQSMARVRIEGRLQMKFRNMLIQGTLEAPFSEINKIHSGEVMNLFANDIDVIISTYVSFLPNLCSLLVRLVGGLILLACFDWQFTLICCGLGAVLVVFALLFRGKFKSLHRECQEAEGKVRSFAQEIVERKEVIKTFDVADVIMEELQIKNIKNYKKKLLRNAFANIATTSYFLFFSVGYYAGLLWGIWQVQSDIMTFGTLTAFLQILEQVRAPVKNLSSIMPQLFGMFASIERVTKVIDMKSTYKIQTQSMEDLLRLEEVSFAYNREIVIKNLNFHVSKGESVGIVGASGSGKSTLIKIILGLLEPNSGMVFLKENFKGFAYVPQGNMLMSGTIKENLTFFSKNYDDSALYRFLEIACARGFVDELPKGMDTDLGEKGLGLSEGQLQRLAIARALAARSDIIIFDEATSALDKQTEEQLINNLKRMDITCIWISHKSHTMDFCDRVVDLGGK